MYYIVLLFAAAALVGGGRSANVNRHMKLLAEIDNHIESNAITAHSPKHFISMTRKLPSGYVHRPGTTLQLNCEATASPAPSVHWFKNDAPIYEYDKESNEIIDTNPSSVARVSSTLLVSRSEGLARYSCLVTAGSKTARSSTLVYGSGSGSDTSERSKLVPLVPRILVTYKVIVDIIGNSVVLPCRVRGHPRPLVSWKNKDGVDIKKDPRMTVLRSGELVISALQWSDMGEFTCRASNLFGSSEVKTFVYPARPSGTNG